MGYLNLEKKILGSYLSGEVIETGSAISTFKKGDAIFGISGAKFGGYAEYITLPENFAFTKMPSNLLYEEAAPIGLGLDSLHFIKKSKLKSGEKILINGAGGGIGTYAVQIAKHYGAHVTVVDSADKLEMLIQQGADQAIDYQNESLSKYGAEYDVIFDVVGAISHVKSLRLLNKKGRYLSAIPEINRILLGWVASIFSTKKSMTGLTSASTEDLNTLKDLVEKGVLKTMIERTYELSEIPEAHRYIESGKKSGNIVLVNQ